MAIADKHCRLKPKSVNQKWLPTNPAHFAEDKMTKGFTGADLNGCILDNTLQEGAKGL